MICEPAPQVIRPSTRFVQKPHSPSVCFTVQPVLTNSSLNTVSDAPIIAPSPKKMNYRGGSISCELDDIFPWEMPTLAEDSDEDSFDGDSLSDHLETSECNEAYAELFNIIHKPSSPRFQENHFEALSDKENIDQATCEYLCRSPISRTQNPLPLDTVFHNFNPRASEIKIHSPHHIDIVDEVGSTLSSAFSKMAADACPINLSFEKLQIRPRSHSVGAKTGKSGGMF